MEMISKLANDYADRFSTPDSALLKEVAAFTMKHPRSQMMSDHVQGRFLEMISKMIRPTRILEIGTFTGYSALCLAGGLQPNGYLHTIELQESDADTAQGFFSKSFHNKQIILHRGNALDILKDLNESWDLIFIDGDKTGYIDYYDLTLPQLKTSGIIIADNVLFHGEVLEEKIKGKNAKAIHAFNKHVAADNRVEQLLVTMRDGLMLIRKK